MLRKAISCALALLALAGASLCAQEYSFRSYGAADGLTNLAVRRIYQDHVGFLWVSTENGIFRYDGDRFEAFGTAQGMPPNSGVAFGDAPDGSLLVGGSFGLYHLSGNRFEKISGPFKSIPWAAAIQSDGKGHTYLGTDAGLIELSSQPGTGWLCDAQLSPAPGNLCSRCVWDFGGWRRPLVRLRIRTLPHRCPWHSSLRTGEWTSRPRVADHP